MTISMNMEANPWKHTVDFMHFFLMLDLYILKSSIISSEW